MPDNIRTLFGAVGDGTAPPPPPPVSFVMIGVNNLGQPMLQMKTNSLIETLGLLSLAEELVMLSLAEEIVKNQARKAAARIVAP